MTDKLKQTIKEEVTKLPKEIQNAISSLDWVKITEEIGKKYSLNDAAVTKLQVETLLVLITLEDLESFNRNIEANVGATKADSELMAKEIKERIFTPMNDFYVESIKKSDKVKDAKPEQNLNFILSGGDYTAFVAQTTNEVPPPLDKGRTEEGFLNSNPPSLSVEGNVPHSLSQGDGPEVKSKTTEDKYREPVNIKTPSLSEIQSGMQKTNTDMEPTKVDDIRSKFTI